MHAGQQHTAAAFTAATVDGLLQRLGIVGHAVALGTKIQYVVNALCTCRQCCKQHKQQKVMSLHKYLYNCGAKIRVFFGK